MRKRNHWLITKELKWETDKVTRIETVLQPRYAQNIIFHRQGMGELEYQLVRFPSGTHDDIIDALQGVVRLLEFPKNPPKSKTVDGEFEWWRRLAIKSKQPDKKKPYVFGGKNRQRTTIPFKQAYK